jgi:hypothetical protein
MFSFSDRGPGRFHMRPVGLTPWIQVELGSERTVEAIDLARGGEARADYEVGITCPMAESVATDLPDEETEEVVVTALPSVPPAERTHAAATAAFDAAEDGLRVAAHSLWLAASTDPADHALLEGALVRREVVELLGNTTLDRGPRFRNEARGHRWPMAQILFTLRDGGTASGHALLAHLAAEPLWSDVTLDMPDGHIDWLILALSANRPPSEPVLAYWRGRALPDDGYVNLTVQALVDNGSDEALSLYVTLLRDARFGQERGAWLRQDIAARRNEARVLEVAERLAMSDRLPPALDRRLVEDLFGDWSDEIRPDTSLVCPDLGRVPPDAAAILRRIGAHALARRPRLGAPTRAVVEAGMAQLGTGAESEQ